MTNLFNHSFDLFLMPLTQPDPRWSSQYQQAHRLWSEVWSAVQKKFEITGPLYLDSLVRQDEGAFIFSGKVCVGLLLFRIMDFKILDYRSDSYFKEWSDLDVARVRKQGSRVFTASYLTVHPDFRNFHPDVRFKQVLMNIMIRRFLASNADVILNTSRRDRNVNAEGFRLGGQLIRENAELFGGRERVDLILFTRQSACETKDEPLHGFVESLWSNRTDWLISPTLQSAQKAG